MKANRACWKKAQNVLVGGVNSPVRSFASVQGQPFFVEKGKGAYLWDVDGNRYIDYVGSWGAMILGHNHPQVAQSVRKALSHGTMFGTPTPPETALAERIVAALPSVEQVRFVSSGTEAGMSAIRLARGATGRDKILKFDGAYHGHSDALLTQAGSGLATLGIPASPGVTKAVTKDTLTAPFNDIAAVKKLFAKHGKTIAAVLVEPVFANIGVVPAQKTFLKELRAITKKHGALLIFDEVITGFRVGYSGAQGLFGIRPDLTVLGKIIGGGFPVGAYAGPKKLMQQVAPIGQVYQAGTLSGHPIAMAAGIATLDALKQKDVYTQLDANAKWLTTQLKQVADAAGEEVTINRVKGLFSMYFHKGPVENGAQARQTNAQKFSNYFKAMLDQGVYLPPSAYEGWFLSLQHNTTVLKKTVQAHEKALQAIRKTK